MVSNIDLKKLPICLRRGREIEGLPLQSQYVWFGMKEAMTHEKDVCYRVVEVKNSPSVLPRLLVVGIRQLECGLKHYH